MKKKLLAFLLAVIMVAAMVCSTAVTAIAATDPVDTGATSPVPSTQSVTGGGSEQSSEPAVVYPEVDRAVAVAELLDENGTSLANLAALDATAFSYVKDGYTIRLLKDISASVQLKITTPGVTWTLDAIKEDGTAAVYTYTGTGYALLFNGAGQFVTVKGLKLNSAKAGIQAGNGSTATSLVLDNVQVRCDGATATNVPKTAQTQSVGIFNSGLNSYLKIVGENTLVQTAGNLLATLGGESVKNTGYLEIYDGFFFANSSVNGVINATSPSGTALTSNAKAVIYGGTFVGGTGTKSAICVGGGSTAVIQGGVFYINTSTGNVAAANGGKIGTVAMHTGGAFVYITGGTFYNARENSPMFTTGYTNSNATKAYVNISGGTFYANTNLGTETALKTATFTSDVPFKGVTKNYGIEISALHKITAEVLADDAGTADVVENQFTSALLGIPAGEEAVLAAITAFTLVCKETVSYDTESDAYKNDAPAFRVYNPNFEEPTTYLFAEFELAMLTLSDGYRVELLRSLTLDKALNLPNLPASAEWTLTSAGKQTYTISISVEAKNKDANSVQTDGYIVYLNGGTLNIENIKFVNDKGGVFVVDAGSVLNVKKNTEIVFGVTATDIAVNAICLVNGEVNIYEGAYLYPPAVKNMTMALVRLFGASTLTVHKGARIGYNTNNKIPDQSGGYLIWISHKNAEVHIYGEVAANYGRAVQGRDSGKVDGEDTSGGKLYVYEGAKMSAVQSNAGVITLYDTEVHIYGGDFYQPTTAGAENSIFMIVNSGNNKTNLYIHGGVFHDSVSANGRMIMSKANSYIEITGGTFFGVSHSLFLMKDVDYKDGSSKPVGSAPKLVIKNGTDEEGNVISIPHFYGPNGKPMVDLRQNATCEISGGYFWANCTGGLVQMYAAGLTVTGGEFYNLTGRMFVITKQSNDHHNPYLKVNDVYIDGANCIFKYKTIFLAVEAESSAIADDSPGARNITVKNVTASGSSHFLYMKACDAYVLFENVTATTTAGEGAWITSGQGSITFNNCNLTSERGALLYFPSSDSTSYHVTINGGTYRAATYVVRNLARTMADKTGAITGITINGGTFEGYNGRPLTACLSIEAGACTVNGGTFISKGSCVVYVGAGEVNNYLGYIYKTSTASLVVNDGYFVLAENGRGLATDAVLQCGSETAYAPVTLNGGVFVSNRAGVDQLIAKNNPFCTLTVDKPVLMANPDATNYIVSVGGASDTIPGAVDGKLAVDTETNSTVMDGEDVKYYVFAYAAPDLASIGKDLAITITEDGDLVHIGIFEESLEEQMGDVLTNGVLVVKKEDVDAAGGATVEALTAAGKTYTVIEETDADNYISILGVSVAHFAVDVADYDTLYYLIGFSKLTVGGVDYYMYNTGALEAVSVRGMAQAMLDDVQDEVCEIGDVSYEYASIVDETKYSPYTTEEQTALKALVDAQPEP